MIERWGQAEKNSNTNKSAFGGGNSRRKSVRENGCKKGGSEHGARRP